MQGGGQACSGQPPTSRRALSAVASLRSRDVENPSELSDDESSIALAY